MPRIDLILCDVGGVLGTNGWDQEQRAIAAQRFALNPEDFEYRHQMAVGLWEEGRMTMSDYVDMTVFERPRPFTREEFCAFMFAQSHPHPEMIALARGIAKTKQYRMMTLNNESAELNQYRITTFGLAELFSAFLSSCYLGARKPTPVIYHRALSITQAEPARTVLIDDREQNLVTASALGVHTIHATTADDVQRQLAALGVTSSL